MSVADVAREAGVNRSFVYDILRGRSQVPNLDKLTRIAQVVKVELEWLLPGTREAVIALTELPLQIKGFGPVKQANAAKAEKRREELLAAIRAGGAKMVQAAE